MLSVSEVKKEKIIVNCFPQFPDQMITMLSLGRNNDRPIKYVEVIYIYFRCKNSAHEMAEAGMSIGNNGF